MSAVSQQDLFSVIRKYNPWWDGGRAFDVPDYRRVAFAELQRWVCDPPSRRAVLLSGARQVGKTTLLRQAVQALIGKGTPPTSILYATFDSPILKLVGLEGVIQAWEEMNTGRAGVEYLFLDEIQYTADWQTWIKHQVDFQPNRRIAVTGSAIPLSSDSPESGVGRWHAIKLPTLSFYEYLRVRNVDVPRIPPIAGFPVLLVQTPANLASVAAVSRPLIPHFHEYLLRGGFPETAKIDDIATAQKLLREDIVDKVLKRDMTALFGTRNVLEMEKMFIYLCLHDGGIMDMQVIANSLDLKKPTAKHYLELFEAAHLVYRLKPHGYGKQILRGKSKYYLADPAISGSVMLRGRSLLESNDKLGAAVETAFFKHVFTRYYSQSAPFSYWRDPRTQYEVDIVAEFPWGIIPFEVKYSDSVDASDLKGLQKFCVMRDVKRAYVITKSFNDFGLIELPNCSTQVFKVPAPLACYWVSQVEIRDTKEGQE